MRNFTRSDFTYSLLGLAILAYYLAAKMALYSGLEYADDLFNAADFARGPFVGKPVFYYNDLINDAFPYANVHAYLAQIICFGPLAYFWGPAGLFVGSVAWFFVAWCAVVSVTREVAEPTRRKFLLIFALLFFGPLTWWFFDDPFHGGHPEILFFPFSILFGIALHKKSFSRWVFGLLILCVQEVGALVVLAVLLAHQVAGSNWSPIHNARTMRNNLITVFIFITIFLLHVSVFQHFYPRSYSRSQDAIHFLLGEATSNGSLLRSVFDLVAIAVLLWLPLTSFWRGRGIIHHWVTLAVLCLPLIATHWFAGFAYKQFSASFGLLWPSRFASVWGITLAAILIWVLSELKARPTSVESRLNSRGAYLLPLTVFVACGALASLFSHTNLFERVTRVLTQGKSDYAKSLNVNDLSLLHASARSLALNTRIGIDRRLTPFFEFHDTISTCPLFNSSTLPSVFVCARDPQLSPNCVGACEAEMSAMNPTPAWHCNSENVIVFGNDLKEKPPNILSCSSGTTLFWNGEHL